jgi:tetratricopeptide (TPR) repeat protein
MDLQRKRLASAERLRELLDSAFASRFHDHATMLKISSTAVVLAEEKFHELPSDLRVSAWTLHGNALRIAGRYQEAERALERAASLPVFDPPTKCHLLEITASLYRNTGRFEGAAEFLTAAIASYRSAGESQSEARTWNILGLVYLDSGDRPQALRAFQSALRLLGPASPLEIVVSTGHNLLETLLADGRLAAASTVLVLLEPYYRRLTSTRLSAKAEWLRARLCRSLQQLPAAQLAFERAYALLSTEPRAPELPELFQEMAELRAVMKSSPITAE